MTDPARFTDLGWADTDGLTFTPAPTVTVTVTVELADWIAPLAGGATLTGGVIEGGMVRFDRPGRRLLHPLPRARTGDAVTVDHPQFGTMCAICFVGLTPETCVVDVDGVKWDVCSGDCARQAGIEERREED